MEIEEVYEKVLNVVDRMPCSYCGQPDWPIPERNNRGIDIPDDLKWMHRRDRENQVPCHVSKALEKKYVEVFGDDEGAGLKSTHN